MHRQSAIFSALLHLAVALIAIFGLPQFSRPVPSIATPIAVEVVTIAETTNPPPGRKDAPEDKKAEAETPETRKTPAPVEQPKEAEKAPEKPAPPEEPAVAALPKMPEKLPEPKEEPKEDPKPDPKATVEPVQPRVKAKPKPKPEIEPKPKQEAEAKPKPDAKPKPKELDMASVLKSVEKMKKDAPAGPRERDAKPEPRGSPSSLSDKPLTISELDAIRRQIERCWNVPAGAKDAHGMVVDVKVMMNPDRTVQRVDVVDSGRMRSDEFFRTMAESAVRAVIRCGRDQPLQLPPDKYETWRNFTLSFNPRDMLGG